MILDNDFTCVFCQCEFDKDMLAWADPAVCYLCDAESNVEEWPYPNSDLDSETELNSETEYEYYSSTEDSDYEYVPSTEESSEDYTTDSSGDDFSFITDIAGNDLSCLQSVASEDIERVVSVRWAGIRGLDGEVL